MVEVIDRCLSRDRIPTAEELVKVLKHFGWNMARVADYFRKDRPQVYRWAEKLAVDPDAHREL